MMYGLYIWKISDWKFDMNSTREITIFPSDLWLENHTRIQYHFSSLFMDEIKYKLYTVFQVEKFSRIIVDFSICYG